MTAPYDDIIPRSECCETIHVLEALGVSFRLTSPSHIKIGKVNFWPSTGKIFIDGTPGALKERGLAALLPLIEIRPDYQTAGECSPALTIDNDQGRSAEPAPSAPPEDSEHSLFSPLPTQKEVATAFDELRSRIDALAATPDANWQPVPPLNPFTPKDTRPADTLPALTAELADVAAQAAALLRLTSGVSDLALAPDARRALLDPIWECGAMVAAPRCGHDACPTDLLDLMRLKLERGGIPRFEHRAFVYALARSTGIPQFETEFAWLWSAGPYGLPSDAASADHALEPLHDLARALGNENGPAARRAMGAHLARLSADPAHQWIGRNPVVIAAAATALVRAGILPLPMLRPF